MTHFHWYLSGFGLGTFKYLFAQWGIFISAKSTGTHLEFFEVFIPTYLGAITSMAFFYFLSDWLMERSAKKKLNAMLAAREKGIHYKPKRVFTKTNKLLVNIKRRFGVVAIASIAPLIFSIPLGSIVCAKFYGDRKITFPIMLLSSAIYGLIMTLSIYLSHEPH